MPKPQRWRDLVPGLLTAAGAVLLAAATLLIGHVGLLHGTTMRLYVTSDEARGVIQGTEVWLNGEKIGEAVATKLLPISTDTSQRVLVSLDVYRHDAVGIRRDSRAQIRPGSSLIGAPVVFFSGGSVHGPAIRENDTLRSDPQTQLDVTRAQFAVAGQYLPEIRADIDSLKGQLFNGSGSLGAASRDDAKYSAELRLLATQLRHRPAHTGTLALIDRGAIQAHAARVLANADSLRLLLAHPAPTTSLGRLQGDSTLVRAARDTRTDLEATRALLRYRYGTVGRVAVDSALDRRLGDADAGLRALMEDATSNPARYSPF